MKTTLVTIGMIGVMALTAATAFAWGPGMGRGFGPGVGPGMADVNLSPEQVAKIQKIQADRYAEMTPVRNEMVTKRTELQALFREPALDQAKIAATHKEITTLQAQMQEKALAARMAVAEVLTPEQRAQMPAFGPGMGPGFGREMAWVMVPAWGPGRGGKPAEGGQTGDRRSGDTHP